MRNEMRNEIDQVIAQTVKTIIDEALTFMANKAGCSKEAVALVIKEDPNGNTARYFKDLIASLAA